MISSHICTQQLDIYLSNESLHRGSSKDLLHREYFQIEFLPDVILRKIFDFFTITEQMEVLTFVRFFFFSIIMQ